MKRVAILLLLGAAATAHADPSTRKSSPQLVKAAGEAFADALAADDAGKLDKAETLYKHAFALAPHPNVAYNLADVYERDHRLRYAIHYYMVYQTLDPAAADHKAVAAHIAKLRATPSTVYIPDKSDDRDRYSRDHSELSKSYIFIDGKQVAKPGAEIVKKPGTSWPGLFYEVAGGTHFVDIISAVSFGDTDNCVTEAGTQDVCSPDVPDAMLGNVAIDTSEREIRVYLDGSDDDLTGKRFQMPAGKHYLEVKDGQYECPPMVIDAPSGDSVRFMFLSTTESSDLERCRTIAVTQQVLAF